MLYDDADKQAAEAMRDSIVVKAERSPAAITKETSDRTDDGLPVHSFESLLADLATLTRNTVVTALAPDYPFTLHTTDTDPAESLPPDRRLQSRPRDNIKAKQCVVLQDSRKFRLIVARGKRNMHTNPRTNVILFT